MAHYSRVAFTLLVMSTHLKFWIVKNFEWNFLYLLFHAHTQYLHNFQSHYKYMLLKAQLFLQFTSSNYQKLFQIWWLFTLDMFVWLRNQEWLIYLFISKDTFQSLEKWAFLLMETSSLLCQAQIPHAQEQNMCKNILNQLSLLYFLHLKKHWGVQICWWT